MVGRHRGSRFNSAVSVHDSAASSPVPGGRSDLVIGRGNAQTLTTLGSWPSRCWSDHVREWFRSARSPESTATRFGLVVDSARLGRQVGVVVRYII